MPKILGVPIKSSEADTSKAPGRLATVAAGTLATDFHAGSIVDGKTVATGDRILLKNQTAGAENGLYVAKATGAPARASDANTSAKVMAGLTVVVTEGDENADTEWELATDPPITLGTTELTFIKLGPGAAAAGVTYEALNGLANDYDPPGGIDAARVILLDATAQRWQARRQYSNLGNGSPHSSIGAMVKNAAGIKFQAFENGSAVTGEEEPAWSTDGTTSVSDGTPENPITWSPFGIYEEWAATTAIPAGHIIFESGAAWQSNGGGPTGGTKPDFASAAGATGSISDGAVSWSNFGVTAGAWQAATRYSFVTDPTPPTNLYRQFVARPTTAVPGTTWTFIGQPNGVFGSSAATEPDWDTAVGGDGSVWMDGDILWNENNAGNEQLILTGIKAPAGGNGAVLIAVASPPERNRTITLQDDFYTDYRPEGRSAEGNRFNAFEENVSLAQQFILLVYASGQWQPTVPPTNLG